MNYAARSRVLNDQNRIESLRALSGVWLTATDSMSGATKSQARKVILDYVLGQVSADPSEEELSLLGMLQAACEHSSED